MCVNLDLGEEKYLSLRHKQKKVTCNLDPHVYLQANAMDSKRIWKEGVHWIATVN